MGYIQYLQISPSQMYKCFISDGGVSGGGASGGGVSGGGVRENWVSIYAGWVKPFRSAAGLMLS